MVRGIPSKLPGSWAVSGALVALVGATSAHAVTPAGLPLALAAGPAVSCGAFPAQDGPAAGATSTRTLKTDAILGGAPSALERIRMSQASGGADGVVTASLAQPAAVASGNACPASTRSSPLAAPEAANLAMAPVASPAIAGPRGDVFLSSPRIAIGRTRFDAEWSRVRSVHLSAAQVEQSMGAPAADRLALIGQVNAWANRRIAYRADAHGGDYWADARRTLRTKSGDCEDIAIVKYQALLSLGVDPSDMYLTIARDLVRHADHALLVVKHDDRFFVLDDSTDALLDGSQSNDYRPILSFGEGGKWLHGIELADPAPVYLSRNELSSPRVIGLIK